MRRTLESVFVICLLAFVCAGQARAADSGDPGEARLRDTLRSTMLELRTAQTDLANLQASQAAEADEKKALIEQIALLKKHGEEDRAASEKTVADLKAKAAAQADQIRRITAVLEQWKAAAEKVNQTARNIEAERAKATTAAAGLENRAADLQSKNEELFRIANEILTRYEKFSIGEQFLAREPFIGQTRVQLENLVQDYDDKILAQRSPP